MEWLKDFPEFLWAVITNWAAYTTGGVIVALLALWSLLRQRPISKGFGVAVALFFLFLAFFNAWQDQKHKARAAQSELDKVRQQLESTTQPKFNVKIGQAFIALRGISDTLFIPFVEIINGGADSVVTGYKVHYKSDSLDKDFEITKLLEELPLPSATATFTLRREYFLDNRIVTIARGRMDSGRLLVVVPGDRSEEINSGKAIITLYIKDYLGNSYSAMYQASGPEDRIRFGPGETGTNK